MFSDLMARLGEMQQTRNVSCVMLQASLPPPLYKLVLLLNSVNWYRTFTWYRLNFKKELHTQTSHFFREPSIEVEPKSVIASGNSFCVPFWQAFRAPSSSLSLQAAVCSLSPLAVSNWRSAFT